MKLERAREGSLSNMAVRTVAQPFASRPFGEFFHCSGCRLELRVSATRVSVETPTRWLGRWNAEQQFVSDCSLSRETHNMTSEAFSIDNLQLHTGQSM